MGRLRRIGPRGRAGADVRFGYRHVILHAQPAAGIAVHSALIQFIAGSTSWVPTAYALCAAMRGGMLA